MQLATGSGFATRSTVVGVVQDFNSNPLRYPEFDPKVFVPLPAQSKDITRVHILVRAQGDPSPLTQRVRRTVRDGSAGSIVVSAYSVEHILSIIGQEILVGTAPLFPLIAIGMLLTTAGIYGVLAFSIARRTGLATWIPSRRALKINPADLLRST